MVERHGVMVLGVCRRMLGNRDEAEDAFQATFLVLAKKASAIAAGDNWRAGFTVSPAGPHSMLRPVQPVKKRGRNGGERCEPLSHQIRPWRASFALSLTKSSLICPNAIGRPFCLCELEGLSRRDAAIRLGISEGTLSSRLARAKSRLRDRLTRRGFALSSAALASVLAQDAQGRVLPPVLLDSTIRVATLVAAGSSSGRRRLDIGLANPDGRSDLKPCCSPS